MRWADGVGSGAAALVTARGLGKDYRLPRSGGLARPVKQAVVGADVDIPAGGVSAIIGESGSGKSTLVRLLLGLERPTRGRVWFAGREVGAKVDGRGGRWLRRETGIVLQDPFGSLDPRWTVGRIIAEPLVALGLPGDRTERVAQVLDRVGLDRSRAIQYPHELSGGQRQRVALARAIVHRPRLLIGDEPLSALDVTIRAQILELLKELAQTEAMSMLLVSHDIGLVANAAQTLWVMRSGRVVEHGPTERVLGSPAHSYTKALLAATPTLRLQH